MGQIIFKFPLEFLQARAVPDNPNWKLSLSKLEPNFKCAEGLGGISGGISYNNSLTDQ